MSIDSLYEGAIAKLTAQNRIRLISQKLLSLKTNEERVSYVYELLEDLKAFPAILDIKKSNSVSTYYRNLGNKCFQNSDYYRAWQYYNLSLLHAVYNTENFGLALSNRSAVFYSLKKYNECINDIDKVFSITYPIKITEKLIKRKDSCKEMLSQINAIQHVNNHSFLTLQDPQSPRFPCASTKLEVVFTEEMGRHVIAKSDIKVGEVLVQEEPYFNLLLKSQYLFVCSYCLSRNLNLLPCSSCCFALYCSSDCKENAWKDYHSVECNLMATIIEMQFTKLEFLAIRTVIKSRYDHSNWQALFKTIEDADKYANTEYRGHVKVGNEWVYDSKYYTSIHTLASNIERRSVSDIFQKSVSAAVFLYMLMKTNFFTCDDNIENDKAKNLVGGLLLLHIMTSPTNMHGISTNIETAEGNFVDEFNIASAPYAFLSLINHSCAPNVVRFSKLGTGQMSLFALRPIKKGMQLFDNYGAHHAIQDRVTRQQQLKFQYKFTCLCEACINDWPTYLQIRPARNLPKKLKMRKEKLLDVTAINKLQKGDKAVAEMLLQPLCELAEDLESYAPCTELADCQESLKQCLEIFLGVVPYDYSKLVEWDAVPPKM
ncbi:unnamed protein product [Diatraea saccharalis]|uniref:Protein-lysine N-methyltransferase SMYD4 n=1 Tax=Diatraea saccharalis TaxID=40085 RepID=A0A9N9R372_9NEOP|nr:unnamed protein product [Diatraea saccharalis]